MNVQRLCYWMDRARRYGCESAQKRVELGKFIVQCWVTLVRHFGGDLFGSLFVNWLNQSFLIIHSNPGDGSKAELTLEIE